MENYHLCPMCKVEYLFEITYITFFEYRVLIYDFKDHRCKIILTSYYDNILMEEITFDKRHKYYKDIDDLIDDNEEFHFAKRTVKIAQHE